MFCMQCGAAIDHDAKFCSRCGTQVLVGSPEVGSSSPSAPSSGGQSGTVGAKTNRKHSVNTFATVILIIGLIIVGMALHWFDGVQFLDSSPRVDASSWEAFNTSMVHLRLSPDTQECGQALVAMAFLAMTGESSESNQSEKQLLNTINGKTCNQVIRLADKMARAADERQREQLEQEILAH